MEKWIDIIIVSLMLLSIITIGGILTTIIFIIEIQYQRKLRRRYPLRRRRNYKKTKTKKNEHKK